MNKSIYSLVLSDSVVEAVDNMARSAGLSRSAMVNQLLAERMEYTTPEMRMKEILSAMQKCMNEGFFLTEPPTGSTLSAKTSLKYRYKPTVRYSVELYSRAGRKAGELRVSFRTQNEQLTDDLTSFFHCWMQLEQRFIASRLSQDLICTITNGRFTRTLNMPQGDITDDELGEAVADYMTMFDAAMKAYFAHLPDTQIAAMAAEDSYRSSLPKQRVII